MYTFKNLTNNFKLKKKIKIYLKNIDEILKMTLTFSTFYKKILIFLL